MKAPVYDEMPQIARQRPNHKGAFIMPATQPDFEHRHDVRIHIDQQHYESPNPTTGEALYILGKVPAGQNLYREVSGNREDKPVTNGPESVHLKEDEHFHGGPPTEFTEFTIIVNGRKKEVSMKTLSFDQLVALAFNPVPVGPNVMVTITYRKGPHNNPEGTLTEAAIVKIKDGMIFDVTETNRS